MGPALLLALAGGLHPQDGPDADVRLAIEPDAARLSVTLNLVFLDEYVEPFREDDMVLQAAEHDLARALGFELLSEQVTLAVDGVRVTPRDESFDVAPPDPALIPHFPRHGTRAMTKLRWVLEYPLKASPGQIELTWSMFPEDEVAAVGPEIPRLEIVAHVKGQGRTERTTLTEDGNRLVWRSDPDAPSRFLDVPEPAAGGAFPAWPAWALWVAAAGLLLTRRPVLAGAGLALAGVGLFVHGRAGEAGPVLEPEQAVAVFEPLHRNLYRAFDYTRREDVYDALARSVAGDLLDELYDQVYGSLVQAEQGGAVSEVQGVRHLELEPLDLETHLLGAPGFTLRGRWQVDGAVFHFGHSHWRTNEYAARFGVARTEDGWRIAEYQVQEAVRVDAAPLAPTREVEDF